MLPLLTCFLSSLSRSWSHKLCHALRAGFEVDACQQVSQPDRASTPSIDVVPAVHAVVGGLHLVSPPCEARVPATAKAMAEADPDLVLAGVCASTAVHRPQSRTMLALATTRVTMEQPGRLQLQSHSVLAPSFHVVYQPSLYICMRMH